jgi:hypothetical protein
MPHSNYGLCDFYSLTYNSQRVKEKDYVE